jgi:hypothetical protein
MFTRKEALEVIREKFPVDKTFISKDYAKGYGTRTYVATPENRLKSMIDLHEPFFDGLKEGGEGLNEEAAEHFRSSVIHNYKNENGLW